MSVRTASKTILPLVLALASGGATAACLPVIGTVKLLPDAECKIVQHIPGVYFPDTSACFSVQLSLAGFPAATGYAGVTSEVAVGADGTLTATPVVIPQDVPSPLPRQIVQTARSVVSLGAGARRTMLYGSDVTIIQPTIGADGQPAAAAVTEQIIITGSDGQGAYANVTGHLTVAGDSRGRVVPVLGKICR